MSDLHVRNVDDSLVRKLHHRAKANRRSVAEEHRQILRDALLGGSEGNWHDLAAKLRELNDHRASVPSEDLIREGRDER